MTFPFFILYILLIFASVFLEKTDSTIIDIARILAGGISLTMFWNRRKRFNLVLQNMEEYRTLGFFDKFLILFTTALKLNIPLIILFVIQLILFLV